MWMISKGLKAQLHSSKKLWILIQDLKTMKVSF